MLKNNLDTHSYKGWLNSDSFIKRALAVIGYSTVGTLIIYAAVGMIVLFFFLLVALLQVL